MTMYEQIQQHIRQSIKQDSTTKSIYFKTTPGSYAEHDRFLGVPNPALRKIAAHYKEASLEEIKQLLLSSYNEERLLALLLLVRRFTKASQQERSQLYTFYLSHTHAINNWNLVDASAHFIVGAYLYPLDRTPLIDLAHSSSLWERRIAIVATWYFIRKGDLEWTFTIATELLSDSHDLIHKAVGWMLREAGKRDDQQLKAFLNKHAPHMPRTMLRYALEKLSVSDQKHYKAAQK